MSIILDALKKADENASSVPLPAAGNGELSPALENTASQATTPVTQMADPVESSKTSASIQPNVISKSSVSSRPSGIFKPNMTSGDSGLSKMRVMVLAALALLAVGSYGYMKFFHQAPQRSTPNAPIVKSFPVEQPSSTGAVNPAVPTTQAESDDEQKLKKIADLKSAAMLKFMEQPPRYKEVLKDYEELLKIAPTDAEVYNNYGVVLKKMNRKKDAEEAYLNAIDLKPDYPEVYNNLGVLYIARADYRLAKEQFEKALKYRPDYAEPTLHLGLCQEKLGLREAAIETYAAFLELADTDAFERTILLQVEGRIAKLKEN